MKKLKNINSIINIIFPVSCINCGTPGNWLCQKCQHLLKDPEPECPYCNRYSKDSKTHIHCKKEFPIEKTISLWDYNKIASQIMKLLKFEYYYSITEFLWNLAPNIKITQIPSGCIVIPIPSSKKRSKERGFNSAKLIAQIINQNLNVPINSKQITIKEDNDEYQSHKTRKERLRKSEKSFNLIKSPNIKGQKILLVDDVCTTGSTLRIAAKILQKSNPKSIYAFTLFRSSSKSRDLR